MCPTIKKVRPVRAFLWHFGAVDENSQQNRVENAFYLFNSLPLNNTN